MSTVKEFTVTWEIQVDATSAREAAEIAAEIQAKQQTEGGPRGVYLTVEREHGQDMKGTAVFVDLEDQESDVG